MIESGTPFFKLKASFNGLKLYPDRITKANQTIKLTPDVQIFLVENMNQPQGHNNSAALTGAIIGGARGGLLGAVVGANIGKSYDDKKQQQNFCSPQIIIESPDGSIIAPVESNAIKEAQNFVATVKDTIANTSLHKSPE